MDVACLFSFHAAWPSVLYSMADRHPQRDGWKGRGNCVSSWACVCVLQTKRGQRKGVTDMRCYDWCSADKPAASLFVYIQETWNLRQYSPPKPRWLFIQRNGATFQRYKMFINSSVKISDSQSIMGVLNNKC